MYLGIGTAVVACLMSCYFAACHIALKTFSKARLSELLEEWGQQKRYDPFIDKLASLVLMTATLRSMFNFIILLAALHCIEQYVTNKLAEYTVAFIAAVILAAVFGVAIPVSWARYHPERIIARSMSFLQGLLWLFKPVVFVLHVFDPIVRRISGADAQEDNENDLTEEVLSVVEEHEHENESKVDTTQKQMIEAVFELPNTTVGEIMTPRTEVSGIEVNSSLEQIKENILSQGHSRIPVYEENIDHIHGMLYSKDLIAYLASNKPFDLRSALREVLMVPESKPVAELLSEFKSRKVHIAIVLDEYGGTAGLVTIEDILEELVGDIQDEHEFEEQNDTIEQVDENTFEIEARIYIDDLNDKLDLELPEDEDYETLGGFVFSTLGHIPHIGESFEYQNLKMTVTEAERTKVNRVRIEKVVVTQDKGSGE